METTNVLIVTKEMIKPSSPTPHHLRTFKLSFLDQISPPMYTPLIFFYQATEIHGDHAQISQLLKQSLSKTLSQFYPLAGRINSEGYFIDCNDAGALFIEAQIHANLLQVVDKPNMEELREYLPSEPEKDNVLLAVQINFFDCGGIALGVKMSHKVADGTSLVTFMNAWGAMTSSCTRDENISQFSFGTIANLFPPRDLSSFNSMKSTGITNENVLKRLLFSKEKLQKLKHSVSSASGSKIQDPTRVEVVSSFIWRHFIEMKKSKIGNEKKIVGAVHAVNLRPRMNPPLPNHAFGNFWRHIMAIPTIVLSNNKEEKYEYHDLVEILRSSIREINDDYVKKIQSGDEYIPILKKSVEIFLKGEIELLNFSSWCRFPIYEVDFGWGKPVWACTTAFPFKNLAILMSTRDGQGIEAWINMLEDDASVFECGVGINDLVPK
ncbi:hypothetical protein M9H77_07333 [Catharanthus roseus]|uniref:Uncharacterized protein n=1 Tax=Catharanthus roseus TaxID=4058 RepID=A0ACC0BUX2_CATRO|nr:hypothetical protein M9H77_07333 [Catharanthus roseus]